MEGSIRAVDSVRTFQNLSESFEATYCHIFNRLLSFNLPLIEVLPLLEVEDASTKKQLYENWEGSECIEWLFLLLE